MKSKPELNTHLHQFFVDYLQQQRRVSSRTIAAYRDTIRLLLRYLQKIRRRPTEKMILDDLSAANVLAFLDYLERERNNGVQTRNARLATLRCLVHYLVDHHGPEVPLETQRILSIPFKRHSKRLVGFLTRQEVEAVLAAADQSWTGRRDHLLFLMLYNTGGRVSEITALQLKHVSSSRCQSVSLLGKGRKERTLPLWRSTQRLLRSWIRENKLTTEDPLLPNRYGRPLSRSGVAWQLQRLVKHAAESLPTLSRPGISPHTFRHSTAMHLLQSGIGIETIALWLGHESPETTHHYIEADLKMKKKVIEKLHPPKGSGAIWKPGDDFMRFLGTL